MAAQIIIYYLTVFEIKLLYWAINYVFCVYFNILYFIVPDNHCFSSWALIFFLINQAETFLIDQKIGSILIDISECILSGYKLLIILVWCKMMVLLFYWIFIFLLACGRLTMIAAFTLRCRAGLVTKLRLRRLYTTYLQTLSGEDHWNSVGLAVVHLAEAKNDNVRLRWLKFAGVGGDALSRSEKLQC